MIRIQDLNKYFYKGKPQENHVLRDIDLELPDSGLVCILGESGSGKTTLLNTMGGLDVFQSGTIAIDDAVMKKYEAQRMEMIRNKKFGYIFQNYYLLQDYTVEYNVKLALNMFDLQEDEKDQRTDYVLMALGMKKYKKKLVSQLSGGQQQRVSIARALVKAPQIILADEPTGNLDEENTLQTMSILKSISKECLVVVVSHERQIARFFADRIIEIKDGKIEKDYENTPQEAYDREDDANIYLKDLEDEVMESDLAQVHIHLQEGQKPEKVEIHLAWKNGKLYLQGPDQVQIVLTGEESGVEMVNSHRPRLEKKHLDEVHYALPPIEGQKEAKLSPIQIRRMAMENLRLMCKKQKHVLGIILAAALLLTLTLADYMTQVSVDQESVVTSDSHYVTVELVRSASEDSEILNEQVRDYLKKHVKNSKYQKYYPDTSASINLVYQGFHQLSALTGTLEGYSSVDIAQLDQKDLVAGRMPETTQEVVVDQWLLHNFQDKKGILSKVLTKPSSLLGMELKAASSSVNWKIVGVCNTQEPALYMDPALMTQLDFRGSSFLTDQMARELYPDEYGDLKLTGHQAYVVGNGDVGPISTDPVELQDDRLNLTLNVVGYLPENSDNRVICSTDLVQEIQDEFIVMSKSFRIYTDDVDGAIDYFKHSAGDYSDYFGIKATCGYQDQMKAYQNLRKPQVGVKSILSLAILLVSLIIIFFTVKSNAISRSEELTVYRLIGISHRSIRKAYLLEMMTMTAMIAVPTILVTGSVMKFLASVPSLEINLVLPWWAMAVLAVALILINALISILPVDAIIKRPPAQLAAKK